jgi:hypothetical protein
MILYRDINMSSVGSNMIGRNTLVKNTLAENTLVKNTLAENTLVKNTLVKNTLAENTLVKNTLAENTLASHTLASHIKSLEKYMFSSKNMTKYNKGVIQLEKCEKEFVLKKPVADTKPVIVSEPVADTKPVIVSEPVADTKPVIVSEPVSDTKPVIVSEPVSDTKPVIVKEKTQFTKKKEEYFIPFQKDKLFWCFYIVLKGFSDYEMHRTGFYAVEKAFKISTVEKLRGMKKEIKELKLKINEVEDELVNKEQITLKGLQVLCIVYKVSITYIYGKKYCEFLFTDGDIKGIIKQTERKEHAFIYEDAIDLPKLKETSWFIENVQKPLKAPASYTLKELQDICEKLDISLKHEIGKSKTKKDLYEDILSKL